MVNIKDETCCGCGLCAEICSVNAIKMMPNEQGFLYPHIDSKRCVNCRACEKVCIFSKSSDGSEAKNSYLVAHRDEMIQMASSSGGAYTAICQAIQEYHNNEEITYYGAAWQEDFTVKHERVTSLDGISRFRKSKYVQSEIFTLLPKIKDDLKNNRVVVFSGTPCQVACVNRFVGKENARLYTIDVVCNGVGSPVALQSYLQSKYENAVKIDMRHKSFYHGNIFYKWFVVTTPKRKYVERMNHFMSAYYAGEFNRISCFSCPYAKKERCSDFTIGDIHTHYAQLTEKEYKNGVSVLLINTEHASKVTNEIKKQMLLTEVQYEDIYKNSLRLRKAGAMPAHYPEMMQYIICGEKNPDKYIESKIPVVPMWKQKVGEMIPEFLWKIIKRKA